MYLFFLLWLHLFQATPSFGADTSFRIDCGGTNNFSGQFNHPWIADRFYTGGSPGLVAEPQRFQFPQERTLRYWPISFGKKNCYIVPVPNGRYFIRMFIVYSNYDSKMHSPSFDISVEGTLVFSWRSPWPEDISQNGAYSDVFTFVKDGVADVCFYSIATDAPVISSLEIIPMDPHSYAVSTTGRDVILVNYGRLTCGSNSFGPGFTNDDDKFGRSWQSDSGFHSEDPRIVALSTTRQISGTNQMPNYFPTHLYQTAVTMKMERGLVYSFEVDTSLDYLLWFNFAEIDPSITSAGQRVFDIYVDGKNMSRVDIFRVVRNYNALKWYCTVNNLNNSILSVELVPIVGDVLISGLECYAMVPLDPATVPNEVAAMNALKESLKVPDRLGWNGDPCAPLTWDAWEGVTCHLNQKKNGLVITQLDLGSQGLKGYISDKIGLLTNLVSLNLSSNDLEGKLPYGIGQKSLEKLDLSNNKFSGSIPQSLSSSNLKTLLLNNNELEGEVLEDIYSVGVHGGVINLSGNKALCGAPTLPVCSLWGRRGLSTSGKVAIGVSSAIIFCILVGAAYMYWARKRKNDYDFGLPHDLMSKRNKYQRQKSLMLLEMESQNANGFPTILNGRY